MIPYSRPNRSDLYTLSESILLENHTVHSGTDPEAFWRKIKSLTALFSDKKNFMLQKRSKKMLLHRRANHEDQKFKNHRKSIRVS